MTTSRMCFRWRRCRRGFSFMRWRRRTARRIASSCAWSSKARSMRRRWRRLGARCCGGTPACALRFSATSAWRRCRGGGETRVWRARLAGLTEPSRLELPRPAAGAAGAGEHDVVIAAELAGRLQGFAQSQHVTVNTLVQGAWALLLGRYGGRSEVVFGMTTAGRPGELAGVERMVGLFINTLPRRVAVEDGARVGDWLRGLQGRQAEEQSHGWCSLVDIQHWSEVASGAALFDTLVVFENYPVAASLRDGAAAQAAGLRVTSGRTIEQVHYPLYLAVMPGAAMVLRFGYRRDLFEAEVIERLAGHFFRLLEELVAHPARPGPGRPPPRE